MIKNLELKTTYKTKYYFLIMIATIFYALCYFFDLSFDGKVNINLYPVFILFISLVFFIIFAIFRIFLSDKNDEYIDDNHYNYLNLSKEEDIKKSLLSIEYYIQKKIKKLNSSMKSTNIIGNLFIISGFIIPFVTWIYTLKIHDKEEKLSNIWSMVFSSTSLGTIAITVGIALLRHSKSIQEKISYLEEKIIHLMSIRSASSSAIYYQIGNASKIELLIYKSLLNYTKNSDSEKNDFDKDETSNITKAAQLSSAIARAKTHNN